VRQPRRLCLLVPLAIVAGMLVSSANGAAPRPGPNDPDLVTMGLQIADLPTGARVARQGYVKDEDCIAEYDRGFAPGTARVRSKAMLDLESDICLLANVQEARTYVAVLRLAFLLIDPDDLKAAFNKESGLKATYVRLSRPASLHVGDESVAMTIRIGTKAGELRTVLAYVRVDRVISLVGMVGLPRAKLSTVDAAYLSGTVKRHMRDGLVPVVLVPPSIAGVAQEGQAVTAARGTWRNKPSSYAYRWQRCDTAGANCADIAGASAQIYAVSSADVGATVRVVVTATNRRGKGAAPSVPTAVVSVAGAPVPTAAPTISGTAQQGQTLEASPGAWTGNPTSFTYQWQRCDAAGAACADIVAATASSYGVSAADAGKRLRVGVTATNATGAATAYSAPTAVVP
jgi:hypothetical protein